MTMKQVKSLAASGLIALATLLGTTGAAQAQ